MIKGPIRPGFMTNVAKNDPKCQAGPSSWPELWTDFLTQTKHRVYLHNICLRRYLHFSNKVRNRSTAREHGGTKGQYEEGHQCEDAEK